MTSASVLLALTNVLFANECVASCARLDTVLKHLQHDREDMEDSFILQVCLFLSQSSSSLCVSLSLLPALPQAHTCKHTRTHTHTHTHTHKRTNTQTHTLLPYISPPVFHLSLTFSHSNSLCLLSLCHKHIDA